ncbi:MAG: hypothetical protein JNJ61_16620 [Anaerolineae bacterium]|nr:hypothetical protein [Anaerolineae bacterium]
MDLKQLLRNKRDAKAIPHLEQYAPVWIVDEVILLEDEAIQFSAIFQHPQYGWVNRRYRYDGFNNVLYHKGQLATSEAAVLDIQEQDPYIAATISNVPNAYGG